MPGPTNTFLDVINQSGQAAASQNMPTTGGDSTQKALELLQTKVSGKQAPAAGTAVSNVGEQLAGQAAKQQVQGQVLPQFTLQQVGQQEQLNQVEANKQNQLAGIAQTRQFSGAQNQLQLQGLQQSLAQGEQALGTEKYKSQLEQAAFYLNMNNKQYVTQLQQAGEAQNLNTRMGQLAQIQQIVFGSKADLLANTIGQENLLQSSKRDFNQTLAKMSVDQAQVIAQIQMEYNQQSAALQAQQMQYEAGQQAALGRTQALGQGIGGLVTGGLQGYQAYQNKQERNQQQAQYNNLLAALNKPAGAKP